jgi:hypothetical protein
MLKVESADPKAELASLEREEGHCSFERLIEHTVDVFQRN